MSRPNGQRLVVPFLACRTAGRLCALPIEHVIETMRPLPIRALADAPPFQLGVSTIRGEVLDVIHLGRFLSDDSDATISRFVTVRLGDRHVALAVDEVSGVRMLPTNALANAPTALDEIDPGRIESIARFDDALISLLRNVVLVSDNLLALADREEQVR